MTRLSAGKLLRAVALALACAAAVAAPLDQPPTWASLNKAQQDALAPLQRDWASLDAARKEKWLEIAGRLPSMPESERLRVQQRMTTWARMTPTERGEARLRFQEMRRLSPEERQARWEAYQALSDEQRRALADSDAGHRKHRGTERRNAGSVDGRASDAKRNIVSTDRPAGVRAVAPTLVQASPGATTTLMSTPPTAPAHQQPGLPKIVATDGFVNPTTLLPRRGPQGAAVQSTAPAASSAHP